MRQRRQSAIVFACVGMLASYFLLQLIPAPVRTTVALTVVPMLCLVATYVAGYRLIAKSRLRLAYLALPWLLIFVGIVVLLPDFRRARLRRQLESLGARVTCRFDEGHPYLPEWMKDELDWAFLGRIKQVDFGRKEVPIADLKELTFAETIWFLNLEPCGLSRAELKQIPEFIDAKIVNLSRTRADVGTLSEFAKMPSIKRMIANRSEVTWQEAKAFAAQNPRLDLDIQSFSQP